MFSENLRAVRKAKNISQEQLAEMLNVSRQAVSKWEQDSGYPETEKLIQIAQKLDVSLDSLLLDQQLIDEAASSDTKGDCAVSSADKKIIIQSEDGKTFSSYYKFRATNVVFVRKGEPKYVLMGTDSSSFLGDNLEILGWYFTHEDAQKEVSEILKAMKNGETEYRLKYNAERNKKWYELNIVNTLE
jgi:transcriptional regulator with XRE-family HTH domain